MLTHNLLVPPEASVVILSSKVIKRKRKKHLKIKKKFNLIINPVLAVI